MNDLIKIANKKNIYKSIYNSNGISKQNISSILNISMPTVNHNLNNLRSRGLIHEEGEFQSTGGRRAKIIKCTYDAKIAIGLDITANHLTTVFLDLKGSILFKERIRVPYKNNDNYFKTISNYVSTYIKTLDIPKEKILGVGISLPVIVKNDNSKIDYASVINIQNDFHNKISLYLNHRCLLFNDANCAGVAEVWKNEDISDIIYLSLCNSVGGAIINSGNIFTGDNLRSGEFGHMTIVPNGTKCYCGNYGCADAYVRAEILSDLENGNMKSFFDELKKGNKKYEKVFDNYLYYLSIVLNNLRMAFDKDILIGGYTGRYIQPYFHKLVNLTTKLNPFDKKQDFLKLSTFEYEASAYGAGIKFIKDFLNSI